MQPHDGIPETISPEDALETAEMVAGMAGIPEAAAWMANLMLVVQDAADSGCPCKGCTEIAAIKNGDVPL
jgi:hypothetical protein